MDDVDQVTAAMQARGLDYVDPTLTPGQSPIFYASPEYVFETLQGFQPFSQPADDREIRRLMAGKQGYASIYLFEYKFSGINMGDMGQIPDSFRRSLYSILAAEVPANLPWVLIEPKGLLDRFEKHLGVDEIEFESDEFNRRFRVHSSDRKGAYDIVNPQAMEALLGSPKDVAWQLGGHHIILSKSAPLYADFATAAVDALQTFIQCIPTYLNAP